MMYNFVLIQYLQKHLVKYISYIELDSEGSKTDCTIKIFVLSKHIPFVSSYLKYHTNLDFKQLMDVTAVDYPNKQNRFELLYNFLSTTKNQRLLLKSFVNNNRSITSLSPLFNSSIWLEREVWDLFGIFFNQHPDLRRILTDYGFDGFPLRKDFPLTGYVEIRYDDEKKRVLQEPLEVSQEFRVFDFLSPWEKK